MDKVEDVMLDLAWRRFLNSLYILVLSAKTQDTADSQIKMTPTNASQGFNIFQALATKPSKTPFDASKIEDVKIVKVECEGFLKMGKSRFRVTFTIDFRDVLT